MSTLTPLSSTNSQPIQNLVILPKETETEKKTGKTFKQYQQTIDTSETEPFYSDLESSDSDSEASIHSPELTQSNLEKRAKESRKVLAASLEPLNINF